MKKTLSWVAILILIVVTLFVAGCGGTTSTGKNGNSTGNSKGTEVTEAELGVPVYPGARKRDMDENGPMPGPGTSAPPPPGNLPSSNGQSSSPGPGASMPPPPDRPDGNPQGSMPGPGRGDMTTLWTEDSASQVIAWYRERLSGRTGFAQATPPGPGGSDQDAASVMYTFKSGDNSKSVIICRNNMDDKDGTYIVIGDFPQGAPQGPTVDSSK